MLVGVDSDFGEARTRTPGPLGRLRMLPKTHMSRDLRPLSLATSLLQLLLARTRARTYLPLGRLRKVHKTHESRDLRPLSLATSLV